MDYIESKDRIKNNKVITDHTEITYTFKEHFNNVDRKLANEIRSQFKSDINTYGKKIKYNSCSIFCYIN